MVGKAYGMHRHSTRGYILEGGGGADWWMIYRIVLYLTSPLPPLPPLPQLIHHSQYNLLIFLQVVVVNVVLNLTWTALLVALILAIWLCGFTSGFFIPINDIRW